MWSRIDTFRLCKWIFFGVTKPMHRLKKRHIIIMASASFFEIKRNSFYIIWSCFLIKVMKINNFRGDVTDISAKKEALIMAIAGLPPVNRQTTSKQYDNFLSTVTTAPQKFSFRRVWIWAMWKLTVVLLSIQPFRAVWVPASSVAKIVHVHSMAGEHVAAGDRNNKNLCQTRMHAAWVSLNASLSMVIVSQKQYWYIQGKRKSAHAVSHVIGGAYPRFIPARFICCLALHSSEWYQICLVLYTYNTSVSICVDSPSHKK